MCKYIIISFLLMLSACSTNNKTLKDSFIILNTPTSDTTDYFEKHFKIESIIPIETTDSFLVSDIKKIIRLKNSILLLSKGQQVSLIDAHSGKLKTCILKRGNGPGESNHIIDIAFDEIQNHILIYNDFYKLAIFDLEGNLLSEVKLDAMFENMTCDHGEVTFYNKIEGYSCYPYMSKIYNLRDKTWKDIGNDSKIDFPVRSKGQQMVKSKRIWINAPLDYKVYCMENNNLVTHYQLNLPVSKLSDELIKSAVSNPIDFLNQVNKDNIIYSINSTRETENHLIFRSNRTDFFLLNKINNTLYKNNFLLQNIFNISPENYYPHEGDDNNLLFIVSAEKWEEQQLSNLPKEIQEKVKKFTISGEDNPILFFFKEIE